MPKTSRTPDESLPLRATDFHILMVLIRGDRHGYGIMQDVLADSRGRVQLEVGTLYRLIARMTDLGLVAESRRRQANADRRRYYRITPYGRKVAEAEARRLADVVRTAQSHDLLKDLDPA